MNWKLTDVSKSYNGHAALRGLDFTPPEAIRCLALIGPSGGGKSTLLRQLAGLEVPDSGEILLDGVAHGRDEKTLLEFRRTHGFLFQSYNLFPHLSVGENITLPLVLVHQLSQQEAQERAEELLSRFELAAFAAKMPQQLSGGQQQRVALIRAVAARPKILFLDEPTAALDPLMTAEVLELVRDLLAEGQRIVLATHEIGFAKAAADHVAFIADGAVLSHGTPSVLLENSSHPTLATFLGKMRLFQ